MINNSRFFFVLLSVGAATGIGNIWLYPYFSFKLTGLFFIPYLVALFLLGVPLLMLEFSMGQYFNKNVVDIFASIGKWFSGVGWLMVINAFIVMSFYAVVFSWHIIYFFVSFGMQWKNDAEAYFLNNIIQVSDGIKNFTQFSLPVFIALIMAWLIIFFYIKKGFESVKRLWFITLIVFIVLLFLFLLYSLNLNSALIGIYSFLTPRLNNLLDLNVWINSFSLAAISLGLSLLIMHTISRRSKGFIVGASSIVVIFDLLISIAVGYILFGILGFLSTKQGVSLDELVFFDFGSAFTILAQALPFFYKPIWLSILFFTLLSLFFLLGASALAYSISHVLVHKFNTKHINAAIIVIGFGFLFSLLFAIKPGFYIMDIVSHFVYYNILIAIFLEVIAISWFFQPEKLSEHINQHSTLKIGSMWRFIIRYLIPLIILILIFFQLKADFLLNYKNYPLWAIAVFGIGVVVVPLIIAFIIPQKILDRR